MAVKEDLEQLRTEKEKEEQETAAEALYISYVLPRNVNDMKDYAWGRFTWRDVIASIAALGIPVVFMLLFQAFIPQIACVIIGIILGIPPLILVNKHMVTGDLPIEERIKISLHDRGERDLLFWDKTKNNGEYVSTSTQSFMPTISFTDNIAIRPNEGGFAVVKITVDDMTFQKYTDSLKVLSGFAQFLNALLNDVENIPIQILIKSNQQTLNDYIDRAVDNVTRASMNNKPIMSVRAEDYAAALIDMDSTITYFYDYYIILPYNKDTETVGNDSMKSASVQRERIKEKANPFKRKTGADQMDFEIGEDRKKKIREFNRDSEYGEIRTKQILSMRLQKVLNFIGDIGTTKSEVKAKVLTAKEIAELFYEVYNTQDKYTISSVVEAALNRKDVVFSPDVYRDFPDIFVYERKSQKQQDSNSIVTQKLEDKLAHARLEGLRPTNNIGVR